MHGFTRLHVPAWECRAAAPAARIIMILYDTRPNVFGNAQSLPFSTGSFTGIALLNVLEHLPDPEAAVADAARLSPDLPQAGS